MHAGYHGCGQGQLDEAAASQVGACGLQVVAHHQQMARLTPELQDRWSPDLQRPVTPGVHQSVAWGGPGEKVVETLL